jgi:hypothetical protein
MTVLIGNRKHPLKCRMENEMLTGERILRRARGHLYRSRPRPQWNGGIEQHSLWQASLLLLQLAREIRKDATGTWKRNW